MQTAEHCDDLHTATRIILSITEMTTSIQNCLDTSGCAQVEKKLLILTFDDIKYLILLT